MRVKFVWVTGVSVLAAALAMASSKAAMDDEINAAINAIADKLEKGDLDGAKKAAKDLSKEDLDSVMHGFKLKKQKGIGLGKLKDTAILDGVEWAINGIADGKVTANTMKKESAALTRAGYVTHAIALVAVAKTPEKNDGKKLVSDWKEWSGNMVTGAQEFSAAAKAQDTVALKKAANKLKQSCDSCHPIFK
jgi:cytochrome c556